MWLPRIRRTHLVELADCRYEHRIMIREYCLSQVCILSKMALKLALQDLSGPFGIQWGWRYCYDSLVAIGPSH